MSAGAAERRAVIARELTKQFEEFRRGTIAELEQKCDEQAPRGEVVLVIAGAETPAISEDALIAEAKKARAEGLSTRDVVDHLIRELGAPRNLAYRIAQGADE